MISLLESQFESRLVRGIKKLGGIAYKFVSPGNTGVPDRIVILPDGSIEFVELKTDTGKLSKIQTRQIERIKKLGATVQVLYGQDDVDTYLTDIERLSEYGQT